MVGGWGMRAYIKIPLDEWEGEFCPLCVTYVLSACNVCQGAVDVLYSQMHVLFVKQVIKCCSDIFLFLIPRRTVNLLKYIEISPDGLPF